MSKVGKTLNDVTEATIKAGGVATKYTTEAISEIGKTLGVAEDTCDKIKKSGDSVGKDIYYASGRISKKVESVTDDVVEDAKKAYDSVKNRFNQ